MPLNVNGYEIISRNARMYEQSNIVRGGLMLNLDASIYNTVAYGSTWFDLSGRGNNGTFINGPTFNSGTGGNVVFDGVDDYAEFPIPSTAITNITITGFVNVTLNRKGAFFRNGNAGNGYAIGIGNTEFDNNGNNILALFPGVRWIRTTTQYNAGWQMITLILDASSVVSGYVNTTPITFPTGTAPATPTSNFYIGRNVGDEPSGARAANCSVGNCLFYNRVLSVGEITHNYNVMKGRFGL